MAETLTPLTDEDLNGLERDIDGLVERGIRSFPISCDEMQSLIATIAADRERIAELEAGVCEALNHIEDYECEIGHSIVRGDYLRALLKGEDLTAYKSKPDGERG